MIYLMNMPNFPTTSPNIALSQFKAILTEHGLPCKVLEMQLVMASLLTPEEYHQTWHDDGWKSIFSKLAWVPFAWGGEHEISAETLQKENFEDILGGYFGKEQLQWLEWYRSNIPKFYSICNHLLQMYGSPKVIGFSCNMVQVLPALATGRMIKSFYPQTKLVYGGPSFFGEMGAEFIKKVDWIDAVATGECDDVVVELFSALTNGNRPSGLRGILYRRKIGGVGCGPAAQPLSRKKLEDIPAPDYDDFFELAHKFGISKDVQWGRCLTLYFEGSRGCWWAQKCQCKFCGRDRALSPMRIKSSDRVYESIDSLYRKYPGLILRAADEAICAEHLETLLPKLHNYTKHPFLYFPMRVDSIDRAAMQKLRNACVYGGLVGIENLSTRLLQLMNKGTTQLQNVYFLKLCQQYKLMATWYMLCRIPGESQEDYDQIERLIPNIHHLPPPQQNINHLQLHRFSRYFAEKSDISGIQPDIVDKLMYPSSLIDPYKVIYIFSANWKHTLQESSYQGVIQAIEIWRDLWREPCGQPPQLLMSRHPSHNGIEIVDTRTPNRNKNHTLNQEQGRIYELAADPCKLEEIMDGLQEQSKDKPNSDRVKTILNEFVSSGLMIYEKRKYLALAIPQGFAHSDGIDADL